MFTKVFDEQVRLHGKTREAIAETIQMCKSHDILKNYISEHETEVQDIMITLFDNEQIMDAYGREKIEEGDLNRSKKTALNLNAMGMQIDKIAQAVETNVATVQEWMSQPQMTPAK